jgi:hypothetical protein
MMKSVLAALLLVCAFVHGSPFLYLSLIPMFLFTDFGFGLFVLGFHRTSG